MKINIRKTIFIFTLIVLGAGVWMFVVHDRSNNKHNTIHNARQSIIEEKTGQGPSAIQSAQELLTKYDNLKQREKIGEIGKIDLSSDEDLTVAVMNLLGIEEHLFFTGAKTKKTEYYDLIDEVREIRKSLLKKLIPRYEGEVWCISKHLLAASYRLMETGTKQLHMGNKQEAYKLFEQGYRLYLMFWKINKELSSATKGVQSGSVSKDLKESAFTHLDASDTPFTRSCIFDDSKINCCAE